MADLYEKVMRAIARFSTQGEAAEALGGLPQQAMTAFRHRTLKNFDLTTVVRVVEATASWPETERITWADFIEHAHQLMAAGIGTGSGRNKRAPPPRPTTGGAGREQSTEEGTAASGAKSRPRAKGRDSGPPP